ncbi:MAG: cell division protein CrgA, partial [Nocardioidaceae bacterium]
MPESRPRKKQEYKPPARPKGSTSSSRASNRWAAPLMLACWLLGLAWVS